MLRRKFRKSGQIRKISLETAAETGSLSAAARVRPRINANPKCLIYLRNAFLVTEDLLDDSISLASIMAII
jgi:hypothetical protein